MSVEVIPLTVELSFFEMDVALMLSDWKNARPSVSSIVSIVFLCVGE